MRIPCWKAAVTSFLRRILARSPAVPAPEQDPPRWAQEFLDSLAKEPAPPAWLPELLEAMTKAARSHARLAAKVEDVERKLEGGFAELRGVLEPLQRQSRVNTSPPEPVLDALDALDEAVEQSGGSLAEGLGAVRLRLEAFVESQGLKRHAATGVVPDGRLFKVVGSLERAGFPDGAIARVVRAAVTRGADVVREGEVLTNRRPS